MNTMGAAFALLTLLVLRSCLCSSKESPADGSQKTGVAQLPQQLQGVLSGSGAKLDPSGKETTAWIKHEPAAQRLLRRMGAGSGQGVGGVAVAARAKGGRARGGSSSLRPRNVKKNGATSTSSYLLHTMLASFLASILS